MKIIYFYICVIYNKIFSFIENIFLLNKKISKSSTLLSEGYELHKLNKINFILNPEKEIKLNNYITKYILKKEDIYKNLVSFFNNNNLKKIITDKTGFEYSVDYIIYYTTFKIPDSQTNKDLYANKWHNDKPFTKNTLKIIIPLNETENYNGGIEILNIQQTKKFKNFFVQYPEKYFTMKSKLNHILLFLPNLCLHKAGNPDIKEGRKQIMIQLNPSNKWCLNKKIYQKQFNIEPKFPIFNYMFDGKIKL
tara:strand:+ start:160 stop:909 length:750 start_codon:yes stop_codon:yes gene_type:complete